MNRIWKAAVSAACVLLSVVGCSRIQRQENVQRRESPGKGIVVFNQDDSHFIRKLPAEKYVEYFDSVCQGVVTHFFMCPNAMRSNVDSKYLEPIWKALDEPRRKKGWAEAAKWLHDNGIDPYSIWTKRAREKGVSPWLSIRMNDIHGVGATDFSWPSLSTMWLQHPEYRRDPQYAGKTYHPYAFDFAHKPVRDTRIGYVREMLERYDVDGVELDWLRFPWNLSPGRELADAHYLTEVVRAARQAADEASKKWGHPVKVACRVLTTYEGAVALGTDPVAWAGEGIIDWLIVCNFLYSADFNLPYADWIRRIHSVNPDVLVIPGTDLAVDKEKLKAGHTARRMTTEEYAGWCDSVYTQGAPGIYLFNFMYLPATNAVWKMMQTGGMAPSAVAHAPRAYPVTFHEYAPGARLEDRQVPCAIDSGAEIRIRVGTPPNEGERAVLRLAFDGVVEKDYFGRIRLNGTPCTKFRLDSSRDWLTCRNRAAVELSLVRTAYEMDIPSSAVRTGINLLSMPKMRGRQLVACELYILAK